MCQKNIYIGLVLLRLENSKKRKKKKTSIKKYNVRAGAFGVTPGGGGFFDFNPGGGGFFDVTPGGGLRSIKNKNSCILITTIKKYKR